MRLDQVLPDARTISAGGPEITGLAYDNRLVTPGSLFFCVPGFTRDGHDFAPDAVARGAAVFGPAAELIRSEALIRLMPHGEVPAGVLALGARTPHNFEGLHGSELLGFLGSTVTRMIARWFTTRR